MYKKNPKKIAVIKGTSIGDFVVGIPLLRKLRATYPNAEIHLVTDGKEAGLPLAQECPFVDRIKIIKNADSVLSKMKLSLKLRKEKYDIVIDAFRKSKNTTIMSFLIKKGPSIGYIHKNEQNKYSFLYSIKVNTKGKNAIEIENDIAKTLDLIDMKKNIDPFGLEKYEKNIETILKKMKIKNKKIVGFFFGRSDTPDRLWPEDRWINLINNMAKNYTFYPVFIGGKIDREIAERIGKKIKLKSTNLAGELSLKETIALTKKFSMFVTTNSGPMHVASVYGIPTIALCGPSHKEWDPYGKDSVVIRENTCGKPCGGGALCFQKGFICMDAIKPERVQEATEKMMTSLGMKKP